MARIAVRRDAFEQGTFPSVCCKTGRPADLSRRWEFSNTPRWTWILLFFGVFPFLIATAFATERFSGVLPMSNAAEGRVQVTKRLLWLFGAAALVSFILSFAAFDPMLPIAFAFAGLCMIAIAANWWCSPSANLDGRHVVVLSNVHRGFVAAIHAIPISPAPTSDPDPTDPGDTLS